MIVQLEVCFRGQYALGHDTQNGAQQSNPEPDSQSASEQRKNQALGKKLTKNLSAICPHRAANRNFSLPRRALGQQQICDVEAGDEQHKADRAQQQPQVMNTLGRKEIILQVLDGRPILCWK